MNVPGAGRDGDRANDTRARPDIEVERAIGADVSGEAGLDASPHGSAREDDDGGPAHTSGGGATPASRVMGGGGSVPPPLAVTHLENSIESASQRVAGVG